MHSGEACALVLPLMGVAFFTLFLGKSYDYYALPLAVFVPFGVLLALKPFENLRLRPTVVGVLSAALLIGALAVDVQFSQSTELLLKSRDEMPQYRFAKTINQVEEATLLNYGFLDGGFYYAADIVPENRFFCLLNIPLAEMIEEQRTWVENGMTDFVITQGGMLEWMGVDSSNYVCVDETGIFAESKDGEFTVSGYFLYQRTW